tara:strand:+ start:532 stop:1098 length:567 start_codon:yes stop_codon:yes gene_type:complete
MATLNATNLKHASSGSNNIVLAADGSTTISNLSNAGKILQVVQTFKTDSASQSGNSSTVFYDIAGMSASITPSSSSNKILVMYTAQVASSGATGRANIIRLLRGSTPIGSSTAGSTTNGQIFHRTVQYNPETKNMMYLDSPNTTSATTYKLQWSVEGSGGSSTTYYINDTSGGSHGMTSHITLMEVAV